MTTLDPGRHVALIGEFVMRSDEEFESGNEYIAAEILWGAFAHGLIAVAVNNGWPYDSHGALRNAARQLAEAHRLPRWRSDFAASQRLHTHFYHGRLNEGELERDRDTVKLAIGRLLTLLNA